MAGLDAFVRDATGVLRCFLINRGLSRHLLLECPFVAQLHALQDEGSSCELHPFPPITHTAPNTQLKEPGIAVLREGASLVANLQAGMLYVCDCDIACVRRCRERLQSLCSMIVSRVWEVYGVREYDEKDMIYYCA